MAQESKTDADWIEWDTSTNPEFVFSYKWSIRDASRIADFVTCDAYNEIPSPMQSSCFKINEEEITLNWYLTAYPNGNPNFVDKSRNLFMVAATIDGIPRAKTVHIKSLKILHTICISELNIRRHRVDEFGNETFLSCNTITSHNRINKKVFSRYKVAQNGGFDIDSKISIQSVTFKYKSKNINNSKNTINASSNTIRTAQSENNHGHEEMLNILKAMQIQFNQMSSELKKISNAIIHSGGINDIGGKNIKNELEEWILNIFNGNEKIGKEYVEMIIENEGFDDIDVFCNLNENDLKEIGINKKGHRMKLMQKIREYNGKKIQSLMMNKNMNVKVAPGAALDVQETEGKE